MARTRVVGVIGYPDVMALDVVGPIDAFATATELGDSRSPAYECVLLGATSAPFASESGVRFMPHASVEHSPPLDTLVVPGGRGLRDPTVGAAIVAVLRQLVPRCRRVASVCTGIYGLAPTGLLDGRRVATHWRYAADVVQRFPALEVAADAIYVQDGPFWTSAGVTAGIDLALALIEADHGRALALAVARELVVYLKRDGGQAQFSEPLRFQSASRDRLADLVPWINGHLDGDLSVAALAARACVSPRHLTRQFRATFGVAPAELVEILRLDEARRRLSATHGSVERIAVSVGFQSDDTFRRAFERRFGVAPRVYRTRFRAPELRREPSRGTRGTRRPTRSSTARTGRDDR